MISLSHIKHLTLASTMVWLAFILVQPISAQNDTIFLDPEWETVQKIPGYGEDVFTTPYLVADQNETVYAFLTQPLDGQQVILLSKWSLRTGWEQPNDIILPVRANIARVKGATITNNDTLHLVFYSGNEQGADLYYTSAPLSAALSATAWQIPALIGKDAGPPSEAAFIRDGFGKFHVIYTGFAAGVGTHVVISADNGETWSEPLLLDFVSDSELVPLDYQLTADDTGNVHAIWSTVTRRGIGVSVKVANYKSGVWSNSRELVRWEITDGVTGILPAITHHENLLIASYIDINQIGGAVTHSFRYSSDNGDNWSPAQQPFPSYVGTSGPTTFVTDAEGVLHMFVAHRIYLPEQVFGIWKTTWQNGRWESLEGVWYGQSFLDEPFDPNRPTPVLVQGNTVLLVWQTDPGVVREGLFYSSHTLGIPPLPIAQPPVPTPIPTSVVIEPVTIADENTLAEPGRELSIASADDATQQSGPPFLLSLLAPTALIVGVMLMHVHRHRT